MIESKEYIDIKFYKLWKHIRITRLQKEKIKRIIFPLFSPFLTRLATYQNWKNSKVFISNGKSENGEIRNKLDKLNEIRLAVVIHVFYIEVFEDILNKLLSDKSIKFSLYLTCPHHLSHKVKQVLSKNNLKATILEVSNHGRDILPFLKILPAVLKKDSNLILKLHTKKSNHLNRKELWSTDIFDKLIGVNNLKNNTKVFLSNSCLGMLGPEGHILPMSLYYGGNAMHVRMLCEKMGLRKEQFGGMNFVAGSMFFARREVLEPVLKFGLTDENFEPENNQLDNTMAHAVERAFAAGLILTGSKLGDSASTTESINCNVVDNHPFTI